MKKKIQLALCLSMLLCCLTATAQHKPAYKLFDKTGTEVSYATLINELADNDVVLFGELHNNPIVHWLQFEVTKSLYEKKKNKLVLGAEMFEADDQVIINEYLQGQIKHKHLTAEAKVWSNYHTDYRPLVELAKENELTFIATNIPRRYANIVARKGLKALNELSDEGKSYIAPLPITVDMTAPGYEEIAAMDMGHGATAETFVHAQAIKDATMAHFILKHRHKKNLFIHYNGDFHSKNYGGIYWYLMQQRPNLKVATIACVESNDLAFQSEYSTLGNFVLVIPESMTKTH